MLYYDGFDEEIHPGSSYKVTYRTLPAPQESDFDVVSSKVLRVPGKVLVHSLCAVDYLRCRNRSSVNTGLCLKIGRHCVRLLGIKLMRGKKSTNVA